MRTVCVHSMVMQRFADRVGQSVYRKTIRDALFREGQIVGEVEFDEERYGFQRCSHEGCTEEPHIHVTATALIGEAASAPMYNGFGSGTEGGRRCS